MELAAFNSRNHLIVPPGTHDFTTIIGESDISARVFSTRTQGNIEQTASSHRTNLAPKADPSIPTRRPETRPTRVAESRPMHTSKKPAQKAANDGFGFSAIAPKNGLKLGQVLRYIRVAARRAIRSRSPLLDKPTPLLTDSLLPRRADADCQLLNTPLSAGVNLRGAASM